MTPPAFLDLIANFREILFKLVQLPIDSGSILGRLLDLTDQGGLGVSEVGIDLSGLLEYRVGVSGLALGSRGLRPRLFGPLAGARC